MPRYFNNFLSLCLFSLAVIVSSAKAGPARFAPLNVAMSDVGPFAYASNGTLQGINYDILTQIAKSSGLKFNYVLYPHVRLANSLTTVSPDLVIFFSVSCLKYEQDYEIQTKLYSSKPTLYLKDFIDIKKVKARIGIIRGTCVDLSAKYLKDEVVADISDMTQAVNMLKSGRLDGVCALPPVIKFSIEKDGQFKQKLKAIDTESMTLDAVICRRKNLASEVKEKLNKAAKSVKIPRIETYEGH